jgi:hypothetical protein
VLVRAAAQAVHQEIFARLHPSTPPTVLLAVTEARMVVSARAAALSVPLEISVLLPPLTHRIVLLVATEGQLAE